MILIKNADVYAPEHKGIKDILVSGEKIELMEEGIDVFSSKIKVIDAKGMKLVPGFIDQHVHITGGGGEGGFKTRVPEITLSKLVEAGITTVVGLLGTDGTTRNVENLISKAKALKEEGVSVYVHTGSYEYPSITVTGSVKKDISFIDEVIGVKVAISDHRSASMTGSELARLAADVRVAGMLSGKPGILKMHMGDGKKGLSPVTDLLETTDIPIKTFRPTHVNRNKELLEQSFEFSKMGGIIDLTCGIYKDLEPGNVIVEAENAGVPLGNITISSDGYGSWSSYDSEGHLVEIGVSQVTSLHREFKRMVTQLGIDLEKALSFITSNVSKALEIHPKKGSIGEGCDADILLLDDKLEISSVIARGNLMMHDGEILVRGTYE